MVVVVASPNSSSLEQQSEKIVPISLPVVDLSWERSKVRQQIVKACEEYGFFNVINHGVAQDTIAEIEEAGFEFFAKPLAEKKEEIGGNTSIGYGCKNIGFNGDIGEVEYLLFNNNAPPLLHHSQNISNHPSNFRCRCRVSAYREAMKELACEILEAMAEGLGVPDSLVFSSFIRAPDSDSVLRLNHYPPIHKPSSNLLLGFGEHSDPQILTILRSNDVSGLQISLQHGVWNPVTPDPSAFSVNVGDLLQVMTNGRFVSVRHRAVTNSEKPRMSIAYFGAPPLDACIVAPSNMVTPERPSLLFRPFTWAEYKKTTYSLRLGDTRLDLFRNNSSNNQCLISSS